VFFLPEINGDERNTVLSQEQQLTVVVSANCSSEYKSEQRQRMDCCGA